MNWIANNITKILGVITTISGTVMTLITTGAFEGLMSANSIRWMSILMTLLGAAITGVGFNNSTKVRVAEAMQTAIRATPGQEGFARVSLLIALLTTFVLPLLMITACVTSPAKVVEVACADAQSVPERCAKGIAETWEVYQKRAEDIVTDASTPIEVKQGIQQTERVTRPVVIEMLRSAALYKGMKVQLAAGATTEDKVRIANENLAEWVSKALPQI
jgi:uncharacterized protein YwbE